MTSSKSAIPSLSGRMSVSHTKLQEERRNGTIPDYAVRRHDDILNGLFASENGLASLLEQVPNQILQAQTTELW